MTTRNERLSGKAKDEVPATQDVTSLSAAEENQHKAEADAIAEGIPGAPTAEEFQKMKESKHPFDLGALDNLDETPGEDLTGEILGHKAFVDGEVKAFFFTGFSQIPDKLTGEPRKAAKLINKEGTFFCPSFIVVQALEKIDEETLPRAVRITSKGMKDGKNNSYWNATVSVH